MKNKLKKRGWGDIGKKTYLTTEQGKKKKNGQKNLLDDFTGKKKQKVVGYDKKTYQGAKCQRWENWPGTLAQGIQGPQGFQESQGPQ